MAMNYHEAYAPTNIYTWVATVKCYLCDLQHLKSFFLYSCISDLSYILYDWEWVFLKNNRFVLHVQVLIYLRIHGAGLGTSWIEVMKRRRNNNGSGQLSVMELPSNQQARVIICFGYSRRSNHWLSSCHCIEAVA